MARPTHLTFCLAAVLGSAMPLAVSAQPADQARVATAAFAQFVPDPSGRATRLDWTLWDQALDYMGMYMGPSLRQSAPSRLPYVGTRIIYGHDSRYRMEGNRIAYELLSDEELAGLTEYREDLERIGSELDIASLPRNEQLAFWLNLHNVAVIEQIGRAYPISQPRDLRPDGVNSLDEAKFITIAGVAMSPHDIRTQIVYPNWSDPRVIYGFFRGDIGGPSLQLMAFTATNVDTLLGVAADEFVNSLRGVQGRGDRLLVSRIYEEALAFYFAGDETVLLRHLSEYANDEVAPLVQQANRIDASLYEYDIADLSRGERAPPGSIPCSIQGGADPNGGGAGATGCSFARIDIPVTVQEFTRERSQKIAQLIEQGRYGRVYVLPSELDAPEID